MEHERCYVYAPPESEERAPKRQRTSKSNPQPHLAERLRLYRELWSQQENRIQATLESADSATQGKIVSFVSASGQPDNTQALAIPTGLVVAGPSIASHGPYFERLGRRLKDETDSAYVVLTSGESPNLKTLLKNLIKKVTSRIDDDDDEDEDRKPASSSRHGPKLLDFDLGHVQEWQRKRRARNIVVTIQDSEAFDTGVLVELIDLCYSWLDRLPLILLFGIATSAESFEDRLSGRCLRYLQGQKFDVTQSDEIIEKLFRATVVDKDVSLRVGPNICRRIFDRQKDHVQNAQDFPDGLKYAYMSHFFANCPSILLKEDLSFEDLSADAFDAIRNLPSFRGWVEEMLDDKNVEDVKSVLESNEDLYEKVVDHLSRSRSALAVLGRAAEILTRIRDFLQLTPRIRLSSVWIRAAAGDIAGTPLLRETMLSIKKLSSDRFAALLEDLAKDDCDSAFDIQPYVEELAQLLSSNTDGEPLRTQYDVRNDSLRTTVVAQKVLLSKHKAALSEQDKAYSDLVGKFYDELDAVFQGAFIDPKSLFLHEIFMYDLKSPHTEVFQPKPRFAIERALSTPHDYLGCDCCGVDAEQGGETALSATQPTTAIIYQLYMESGALINVSDLWSAFNAIVGDEKEEDQSKTMALFQRGLAELRYLGLVKPSRKKTDHISKMMWRGL